MKKKKCKEKYKKLKAEVEELRKYKLGDDHPMKKLYAKKQKEIDDTRMKYFNKKGFEFKCHMYSTFAVNLGKSYDEMEAIEYYAMTYLK